MKPLTSFEDWVKSKDAKRYIEEMEKKEDKKFDVVLRRNGSSQSRMSISKKYTSIRNLMENLFHKDKNLTFEVATKQVLKEYPKSKFNKHHFSWYKNQIGV